MEDHLATIITKVYASVIAGQAIPLPLEATFEASTLQNKHCLGSIMEIVETGLGSFALMMTMFLVQMAF